MKYLFSNLSIYFFLSRAKNLEISMINFVSFFVSLCALNVANM